MNTARYKDLDSKYVHICPYNSIIGMLLYHDLYYIRNVSELKIAEAVCLQLMSLKFFKKCLS